MNVFACEHCEKRNYKFYRYVKKARERRQLLQEAIATREQFKKQLIRAIQKNYAMKDALEKYVQGKHEIIEMAKLNGQLVSVRSTIAEAALRECYEIDRDPNL